MNQAESTIENEVAAVLDTDFGESVTHEGKHALLFFWDGKKVHRITDERLKEEMARMINYRF